MRDAALLVQPMVRLKAQSLGAVGAAWLADLPELVAEFEQRWSFQVKRSLRGGTSAYVALATTTEGAAVVLKLRIPDPQPSNELEALARADGRGYVRLLAYDANRSAMLLEALGRSLDRAGLTPEQQIGVLCRLLHQAWAVPPPASGTLAEPRDQASVLARLVTRLWDELAGPCSEAVLTRALTFARRRAAAFDAAHCVPLHGDAAAANALEVTVPRPGAESGFVFVDPEPFMGDPAYDCGVALRDWCTDLLASDDPVAVARRYCQLLSAGSGIDEQQIWEWGYLERVSTGLYTLAFGAEEWSRPFLQTAERLVSVDS